MFTSIKCVRERIEMQVKKENEKSVESLSAVDDLVGSLDEHRLFREVTLALRTGLRDARSDFSFLRLHGLLVPVLFQHSLHECEDQIVNNLDHIFSVQPLKIKSPSTDAEVSLALRVLEGCCLLHKESRHGIPESREARLWSNTLRTSSFIDFEECNGIEEVALLIGDKQADENLRMKCGEFLLLLIGHVNGREGAPMAAIHEDIRRLR
ncbi:armadillo-type fold protein [Tanacetum coccineum]